MRERVRFAHLAPLLAAMMMTACSSDDGKPATQPMPVATDGTPNPASAPAGTTAPGDPANAAGASAPTAGTGAAGSPTTAGGPPPGGTGGSAAGTGAGAAGGGGGAPRGGTAAPGPVGPNEWRMMGYDLGSTYFNSAETTITKENAAQLEVAWRTDMGTNTYGAPLQIGDVIYASSGARVVALDAASGDELWRNSSARTTGSMAYDEGTLYLNQLGGGVVALDASDGSENWSRPADSQSDDGSSSPIIAGDLLLVGGANGGAEVIGSSNFRGYAAAMDKATGDVVWTAYTVPQGAYGAAIWSTVAVDVAGNRVFGATGNNHRAPATDSSDAILAFDLSNGTIQWKNQRTEGDTWSFADREKPDADFGANPVLYAASVDGTMTPLVAAGQKSGDAHAVRRDDGELVWTRSLCPGGLRDGRDGIFVNGAWSGRYLIFACNGGLASELFGVDGATGDIAWQLALPDGEVYGRISVANGVGFVGSGTNLVIFDTDSGALIKKIPAMRGTVAGTISIANGRVAYGEGLSWANGTPGSTLTVLSLP